MGESDPAILERAGDAGRILLTHDRKTMPDFAYDRVRAGLPMPGVFVVSNLVSVGEAVRAILLVMQCSSAGVERPGDLPAPVRQKEGDLVWLYDNCPVPNLKTALPGPRAQSLLERDQRYTSPSYTRVYPLVVERGSGAVIEDVDGNLFLDFTAGIAVTATGHCHPKVVAAITGPGGQADPHVRHRFLLRAANRPGANAWPKLAPRPSRPSASSSPTAGPRHWKRP